MTNQTTESRLNLGEPKIGVIIPVYGDSDSVCWILGRFRQGLVNTICLVVDIPLKRAMDKIREAARQTGITVHIIKNGQRTGVGSSLRQGLAYLMNTEHDIAVIMAGNGKDDPAEIIRTVHPVIQGESDYVQGSRYLPGGKRSRMPLTRIVFNRLYPLIWTILTQRKCTDVTNGFRCFRLDVLADHRINLDQDWLDGYSLEYYLYYKALTLGYKVKEVPVSKTYSYNHRGGYSKIQPLKDWWPIASPLILLFLGVRK
jgi:glycosyltransferase involved in cell wall biosynthesis